SCQACPVPVRMKKQRTPAAYLQTTLFRISDYTLDTSFFVNHYECMPTMADDRLHVWHFPFSLFTDKPAAVNVQGSAGDKLRLVRCQVDSSHCNVFGPPPPADIVLFFPVLSYRRILSELRIQRCRNH